MIHYEGTYPGHDKSDETAKKAKFFRRNSSEIIKDRKKSQFTGAAENDRRWFDTKYRREREEPKKVQEKREKPIIPCIDHKPTLMMSILSFP